MKIVGQRGETDYLVEVGRGDALGQTDVPLGRVFSYTTGELAEPALPISSIVARGYWRDVDAPDAILSDVRERVAALLAD